VSKAETARQWHGNRAKSRAPYSLLRVAHGGLASFGPVRGPQPRYQPSKEISPFSFGRTSTSARNRSPGLASGLVAGGMAVVQVSLSLTVYVVLERVIFPLAVADIVHRTRGSPQAVAFHHGAARDPHPLHEGAVASSPGWCRRLKLCLVVYSGDSAGRSESACRPSARPMASLASLLSRNVFVRPIYGCRKRSSFGMFSGNIIFVSTGPYSGGEA